LTAVVENPYLTVVERNVHRVLSLFNLDHVGGSLGIADRRYWAWKTVDFPNASMQGLGSGIARFSRFQSSLPSSEKKRLDAIALQSITALKHLTSRSGGLAEAFPNEDSFCVTGQVLSDSLDTLQVLRGSISESDSSQALEALRPLAKFMSRAEERHAVISNHLATSALALVRWANLTGETEGLRQAANWINRVRHYSSEEGWFLEYGGADPGYQSWALSSLAQIHREAPTIDVDDLLAGGFRFLSAFVQSNGSFANGCGSRMTKFLFCAGAEILATSNDDAAAIASFARKNITDRAFVSLDAVDEPNITPFFNDLMLSAELFSAKRTVDGHLKSFQSADFPLAGLYVRGEPSRTMVISSLRGGWFSVAQADCATETSWEPVAKNSRGKFFIAGRADRVEFVANHVVLDVPMMSHHPIAQSPGKFLLLRVFVMSLGRVRVLRELLKWILARILIFQSGAVKGVARRTIDIETGVVKDEIIQGELTLVENTGVSPGHMASQGYWGR